MTRAQARLAPSFSTTTAGFALLRRKNSRSISRNRDGWNMTRKISDHQKLPWWPRPLQHWESTDWTLPVSASPTSARRRLSGMRRPAGRTLEKSKAKGAGSFAWNTVLPYMAAQMLGGLALGTSGNIAAFNGSPVTTGGIGAFPVTALIMALGMSLGSCIRSACRRDFGSRDLSDSLLMK